MLNLTQPDVIRGVHEAYLAAGSDIVETNTFGATAVAQADYNIQGPAREMNREAAGLARQTCDQSSTPELPRFVAGAIGPTPRTASISPEVNDASARNISFDELRDAYLEQVEGFEEGGADLLLVEIILDTLNAKAASFAIDEFFEASGDGFPVILSCTVIRCLWPHLVRSNRARVLEKPAPCKAFGRGPELRNGRGLDAALFARAVQTIWLVGACSLDTPQTASTMRIQISRRSTP